MSRGGNRQNENIAIATALDFPLATASTTTVGDVLTLSAPGVLTLEAIPFPPTPTLDQVVTAGNNTAQQVIFNGTVQLNGNVSASGPSAVNIQDSLDVQQDVDIQGTLDVGTITSTKGDPHINVTAPMKFQGGSAVTIDDDLVVTGTIDMQQVVSSSTGAVSIDDAMTFPVNQNTNTTKLLSLTTTNGIPSSSPGDGTLAYDKNNDDLYLRKNGAWVVVESGGDSDTLSEVLTAGNTSGGNDIVMSTGQQITFTDGIAIGLGGNSLFTSPAATSIAMGNNFTDVSATTAIGIGNAITIQAGATNATLVGHLSSIGSNSANGTVLGADANVGNITTNGTAIGFNASVSPTHNNSTALGQNSLTTAANQIMLGTATDTVTTPGKIQMPALAAAADDNLLTISTFAGAPLSTPADGSLMVDTSGNTFYYRSSGVWQALSATGVSNITQTLTAGNRIDTAAPDPYFQDAIAIGGNNALPGAGAITSVVIGGLSSAAGGFGVVVGDSSNAGGIGAVTIGAVSSAPNTQAVAIGFSATATHNNSVALGGTAATTAANQIRLGTASEYVSIPKDIIFDGGVRIGVTGSTPASAHPAGIAIGDSNTSAPGQNSVVIGAAADATNNLGVALGTSAQSTHLQGVAIGPSSATQEDFEIALGSVLAHTRVSTFIESGFTEGGELRSPTVTVVNGGGWFTPTWASAPYNSTRKAPSYAVAGSTLMTLKNSASYTASGWLFGTFNAGLLGDYARIRLRLVDNGTGRTVAIHDQYATPVSSTLTLYLSISATFRTGAVGAQTLFLQMETLAGVSVNFSVTSGEFDVTRIA